MVWAKASLHLALAYLLAVTCSEASAGPQPNPPIWPSSVQIFGPADTPAQIQASIQNAFAINGGHAPTDHGQFSSARFAFLFRPGTYHTDVPVGYYTQVCGLGKDPGDVIFDSPRGVYSEEGDQSDMGGALSTFWRGAENFRNRATLLWAVSQAAPLRRVIADADLSVAQYVAGVGMGYSSGGFIGNVQVGGVFQAGSQQQFCTRNAQLSGGASGGVWNMVFVGTSGAPPSHCGQGGGKAGTVTVQNTPLIAEKPFITIDESGRYYLQVPPVQRGRVGPDFNPGAAVDFSQVFVATVEDTSASINAQLAKGLHVVLSPGVYNLDAALEIQRSNQVLLGLGLATLIATQGTPVIRVANVDGVRIAGVLLQAGPVNSETLLEWGEGAYPGDAANPGFLHDIFARVGGPSNQNQIQVRAEVMVRINSGHVVGDNLWLWRADHSAAGLVKGGSNPCRTGLIVGGNDVTMYGLAVEHTLGDLVQWSGDRGRTYFFQSELPYDVTQAYGDAGYVGYRVNSTVASHTAVGVGVYHFFRDFEVIVERGISAPAWIANSFESPLSVYLTGKGKVLHVLNDRGVSTGAGSQVSWSCNKGPPVPYNPAGATAAVEAAHPTGAMVAMATGTPTTTSSGTHLAAMTTTPQNTATELAVVLAAVHPLSASTVTPAATEEHREVALGQERASIDPSLGRFVPWWVYLVCLQACVLILMGLYVLHLRGQLRSLPKSPTSAGRRAQMLSQSNQQPASQTLRPAAQQHAGSSPVRLRGLAALSRTVSLTGPSPAAHSDTARSLCASPAESAFGARSPFWRPEEE